MPHGSRYEANKMLISKSLEAIPSSTTTKRGRKAMRPETEAQIEKSKNTQTQEDKIDANLEDSAKQLEVRRVDGTADLEKEQDQKLKKAPVKRKLHAKDDYANENTIKKKRKTKDEVNIEVMPLAPRTAVATLRKAMNIGAHVSGAGGIQNSIRNALHIGGNSFAVFLKSQRKWSNPALAPEARDQFKAYCIEHKFDATKHVLPHGSYLVNLAQSDSEKADQAYASFLDDLQRCEALGIKLYNFHPGSTGKNPRAEAIARLAAQLNRAHKATDTVITVIENMAGAGNIIGSTWEDLRDIIALIDDKSRVGVCIDTCHAFAAGYDIRSPEAFKETMDCFSNIVGMSYLKALHLNDSKTPLSSNRDLHANIGTGFLGLRAFHNVVNFDPFQDLPMVLETPIDKKGPDGKAVEDKNIWATEIKLLESLIGIDPETSDFKAEEKRLQDLGADERRKFQGQVDKKQQKTLDSISKNMTSKKTRSKAKIINAKDDSEISDGSCNH